jgi:hypothetical protein
MTLDDKHKNLGCSNQTLEFIKHFISFVQNDFTLPLAPLCGTGTLYFLTRFCGNMDDFQAFSFVLKTIKKLAPAQILQGMRMGI